MKKRLPVNCLFPLYPLPKRICNVSVVRNTIFRFSIELLSAFIHLSKKERMMHTETILRHQIAQLTLWNS